MRSTAAATQPGEAVGLLNDEELPKNECFDAPKAWMIRDDTDATFLEAINIIKCDSGRLHSRYFAIEAMFREFFS
jgi:hypothetical protein